MGESIENSLKDTLSLRTSAHTGVALSKDSLRSQSVPMPSPGRGSAPRSELKFNNCQWQLLHNVKVARRSRDG